MSDEVEASEKARRESARLSTALEDLLRGAILSVDNEEGTDLGDIEEDTDICDRDDGDGSSLPLPSLAHRRPSSSIGPTSSPRITAKGRSPPSVPRRSSGGPLLRGGANKAAAGSSSSSSSSRSRSSGSNCICYSNSRGSHSSSHISSSSNGSNGSRSNGNS